MSESIHEKLKRVHQARVHIAYEVETEGAMVLKELPFVVGVMGDFSGNSPTQPLKSLVERKFIQIDRDNFNAVMEKMNPGLKFWVDNTIEGENKELSVELAFKSIEDFEPANLVQQIESLRKLLETRINLRELMFMADSATFSSDSQILERIIMQNPEAFARIVASDKQFVCTDLEQSQAENTEQKDPPVLSLLDQAIQATKQVEPDRAKELLDNLVKEALIGTVSWDKNETAALTRTIQDFDNQISQQLAAVMHHQDFLKLEGSWRGLQYLVMNSETGATLKIRVLNISKAELLKDLKRTEEYEQSKIFSKIYISEFIPPGGEPYGALIGDYEFTNHPDDMALLSEMSQVASAAFAPFITAADPALFGFDSWTELELTKPRDLAKIFDSVDYIKWKCFRESEDSRFVALTMPRALARLPYGASTKPVEEFAYEEAPSDGYHENKVRRELTHDHYCWMNTAYVLGVRLTDSFSKYGCCNAICGEEGGGLVDNLPTDIFTTIEGDRGNKGPAEVGIFDPHEAILSMLGFLPLCNYKYTDYAVFFGEQTSQLPKNYGTKDQKCVNATANAAIWARLPYIMATSRFAHYIKVMVHGRSGAFMKEQDTEDWLNDWILNYVTPGGPVPDSVQKAKYPLREARIAVETIPGKPGYHNAVVWLRPWLPREELTAALRMVVPLHYQWQL